MRVIFFGAAERFGGTASSRVELYAHRTNLSQKGEVNMNTKRDNDRALFVANRIAQASPHECRHMFEDLRRRERLSETVRRLNHLLGQPAHHDLAKSALKRFGLDHGG
jgi:hypothetical protein